MLQEGYDDLTQWTSFVLNEFITVSQKVQEIRRENNVNLSTLNHHSIFKKYMINITYKNNLNEYLCIPSNFGKPKLNLKQMNNIFIVPFNRQVFSCMYKYLRITHQSSIECLIRMGIK